MKATTSQGITNEFLETLNIASDGSFGIQNDNILIPAGVKSGYSSINKFGENNDVDSGAAEDIWNQGGLMTYSTIADIDTISSSQAADSQQIEIQGLDSNYNLSTQIATLDGQNKVTISPSLIRVFRMKNLSSTDLTGIVYCYVDSAITNGVPNDTTKIRAIINATDNQTLMSHYTIPAGKTGFMSNFVTTIGRTITSVAHMHLNIREFGKSFAVKASFDLDSSSTSIYLRKYEPYLKIDAKSDIKFTCASVTANNTVITAQYDLIIVDNSVLGA
jgi:hypothetical protein